MLKREIKYETFDDPPREITEVFYFNISKPELIELEVEFEGGLSAMITRIIESDNKKALIEQFKRIILLSYGERSDDGKLFVKNDQILKNFSNSAAYASLFMELATDDGSAVTFLKGVLPNDMKAEIDKAEAATPAKAEFPGTISAPTPPTLPTN